MGEGEGGEEISISSLPFSLPSFPFSPRNAPDTQAVEFLTYQLSQHNTTYLLIIWNRLLPGGEQGREINLVKRTITFTNGAFHLPELAGQTSPVVRRIPILIRTIQPDQIICKWCMQDSDGFY